jgi:hypothetical protein
MYILRDFIYSALFGDLIGLYYGLQEYDEKPTRDLRVHVRMALLSAKEKAAFTAIRPFRETESPYAVMKNMPNFILSGKEEIEHGEWDREWAEAEYVLTADDIEGWRAVYPWTL